MGDWKNARLTDIAEYINGFAFKPSDFSESGVPIIRIEQIKNPNGYFDYYDGKIPERNWIDNGDLIFSWSASLFLKIWQNDFAYLNQHLFKVLPKEGTDKFFLKYLLEDSIEGLLKMSHGSTMQHITRKELKNFEVKIPSEKTEQITIATILNTIDQAIRKTEQLIAKYERIKTGLMQDLLARGIDEEGNIRCEETHEFKDSQLGRIPKEWEVKKVKDVAKITTGSSDTQDKVESGLYPFFVRSQTIERSNRYLFDGEGILTSGDGVGVGKIYHYVNTKFDFHQRVYLIYDFLKEIVLGKFFFYFFKENFYTEVSKYSAKTTVDSVRLNMIADMLIPVPEFKEQQKITSILNETEAFLLEEIDWLKKLKLIKTALMQDLLTGKVRVDKLLTN